MVKFINEVKEIIEGQFRFEKLALFGEGPFELVKYFKHIGGDITQISSMGHQEKHFERYGCKQFF